jgi:hypothetical protein
MPNLFDSQSRLIFFAWQFTLYLKAWSMVGVQLSIRVNSSHRVLTHRQRLLLSWYSL